jgi:hypothetical protein
MTEPICSTCGVRHPPVDREAQERGVEAAVRALNAASVARELSEATIREKRTEAGL